MYKKKPTQATRNIAKDRELARELYQFYFLTLLEKPDEQIEKIYRSQDDNFTAQTLSILFKRTDLTRTEHYAPAHLKLKVNLFKKQNAEIAFPYILDILQKITKITEKKVDEEINLQELLDTLSEEVEEVDEAKKHDSEEEEEDKEEVKEQTEESVQLAEALNTVQFLRDQLNEINLLNAKLLYTNKLFNKFSLNQAQKMKVVETFDLTSSIREVKLSYKILSESLSSGGSAVKKPNTAAQTITEGLASKPVASTAPKKELIVENSNVMASRFQRLAGIKK